MCATLRLTPNIADKVEHTSMFNYCGAGLRVSILRGGAEAGTVWPNMRIAGRGWYFILMKKAEPDLVILPAQDSEPRLNT